MANPMFEKLIAKKKAEGKTMSPVHQEAKSSVLGDLMDHLGSMGMDKVNGMKKVSVASNSKDGLKHGLDKAKDLLNHTQQGEDDHDPEMSDEGANPDVTNDDESEESDEDNNSDSAEGSDTEEASESPDEEASEDSSDKSHEEKDAEIAHLKAQLAMHKRG